MSPITLSDFKLQRITYEFRYKTNYLLYDRAGSIWSCLSDELGGLKAKSVKPNECSFFAQDRYELSVQLDRAHLIDMSPTANLKEFIEASVMLNDLISDVLEVSEYSRLGLRLLFAKEFDDEEKATEAFLGTGRVTPLSGKVFGIKGKIIKPNLTFSWEGEDIGLRASIFAGEKNLEVDISPNSDGINSIRMKKIEMNYDVDYYTVKNVRRSQLSLAEWISQSYRLIKKDSDYFLRA